MDPKATLQLASEARDEANEEACLEHLADYFEWRLKGGFEPTDGDRRALELLRFYTQG